MTEYGRALLVSSDTKGYGAGTDKRHETIQEVFVRIHEEAARAAGLNRESWLRQPAGDGELACVPQTEREPSVVDAYVRELDRALGAHNTGLDVDERIRIRVAMHYGVAYPASNGLAGQAVVEVSRLVDWKPLKKLLDKNQKLNLVLILSDRVFTDVVSQGHTSYEPKEFVRVNVKEKEFSGVAWVWGPEGIAHDLTVPETPRPPAQQAEVINNLYGSVDARRATFGVGGDRR
ncbi:hypothetical protein AB0K48_10770 [Nonomuraea sp. NPDC055795]